MPIFFRQSRTPKARSLTTLLAGTAFLGANLVHHPLTWAAPATAGLVIENQATGTFVNPSSSERVEIESNIVQVTVAEITGVTLTSSGVEEAPNTIANAGPNQENGVLEAADVVYYQFTATNVGNDPTQFFIPGQPSSLTNATQAGQIEIIQLDPDGPTGATAPIDFSNLPITIRPEGNYTGDATAMGLPSGAIPAGGTLTLRVPVKLNAGLTNTDTVTITLGEVAPNDNSVSTQNQDYVANGSNLDFYTQDNRDTDGIVGEVNGRPINGDTTFSRKEASATTTFSIGDTPSQSHLLSGIVFRDEDASNTNNGELGISDVTVRLYRDINNDGELTDVDDSNGNGVIDIDDAIDQTTTDSTGLYQFSRPNGHYLIEVDITDSDLIGLTYGGVIGTANDLLNNPRNVDIVGADVNNGLNFPFDIPPIDYGDAPDSYGTSALDTNGEGIGATHIIVPDLYLGIIAPDAETDAVSPLDATGDGAEDDSVILPASIQQNQTLSIPITVTGSGLLNAWIDWNADGDFLEPNEQIAVNAVDGGTGDTDSTANTITLSVTVPANATPSGNTYVRLRYSSTTVGPTGAASDGEVEDYTIAITAQGNNSAPFICDTSLYMVIGEGGNVPRSQLNVIDRSTDPYSLIPIGPEVTNYGYNALAYNPVDNYLYAFVNSRNANSPFAGRELLRIGTDGIPQSLGIPQGDALSYWPFAGTFLADGTYVVGAGSNPLFAIDLTTPGGPTATQLGPVPGTSFTDFAATPLDGNLIYGVNETSDQLVSFDIGNVSAGATPVLSANGDPIPTSNINSGSQFIDPFGKLLFRSGSNQGLYVVDPDAGTETFLTTTPTGGNHDGASCFSVGLTKVVDATDPVPAGQTVTYTYGLSNISIFDMVINLEDDLRAVTDATGTTDIESETPVNGTYTGVVTTPSGTVAFSNRNQTLNLSNISVPSRSSIEITAEVTIPETANPETYYNQARITGLPPGFVSQVLSDNPTTPIEADPTAVVVTAPLTNNPNVLLVKRITQINGNDVNTSDPSTPIPLNVYDQDDASPYDDNILDLSASPADTDKWPGTTGDTASTFLIGARNGGTTEPGDEIEYTIYFLSTGETSAKDVVLCDRLPDNQTFVPDSFNTDTAAPGGVVDENRGILVSYNGTNYSFTNIGGDDTAQFYPPGSGLPPACNVQINQSQHNGAVVINLGDLPPATGAGTPSTSSGYIRFRATVD